MTSLPLHLVVNWPVFTILYLLFYYRDITSTVSSKDFEEGQVGIAKILQFMDLKITAVASGVVEGKRGGTPFP